MFSFRYWEFVQEFVCIFVSLKTKLTTQSLIVFTALQEYEEQLSSGAVAYINLDAAVRGELWGCTVSAVLWVILYHLVCFWY